MRALALILALVCAGPVSAQEVPLTYTPGLRGDAQGFAAWLEGFRPRAEANGIDPALLDRVLPGLEYLPKVVDRDRRQDEFTRAIWDYMDRAVSEDRIALGLKALKAHEKTFDAIEAAFGVDRHVVAAVWGLESSYGQGRGDISVLSALATLAYDPRRAAYFEGELLAALRMVGEGHADLDGFVGSWAGASGHTQFMPTSFWTLAVDFDGDGRRNLWGEDPTDALASTAAYLRKNGWQTGQPWGFEVALPEGFNWDLAGDRTPRPMAFWAGQGVARADGAALPMGLWSSVILPAGHRGPALMIFDNFGAIETYNLADAYVIAIGHLSDRLAGGGPIRHDWPRDLAALTLAERIELQTRLTQAGFSTAGVDGRIGPRTLNAIKAWQRAQGAVADGFASSGLLAGLRAGAEGEGRR